MKSICYIKPYLTILLLSSLLGKAQVNESTKLPELSPVSPKSFEFLKYGEIPVSKYTGVASTNVPIYTINAKGLDIPIALTYHSNGFRVNEEAGWTGLGWSLSGGGAIVQVLNAFDDFGNHHNREVPNFEEVFDIQTENCSTCPSGAQIFGNCDGTILKSHGKYNNQLLYNDGFAGYYTLHFNFPGETPRDHEPDIFKFNMAGYSGEFILDWQNETFVCLTDSKMKITADYQNTGVPQNFAIIVPEGHKFTFQLKEETKINTNFSLDEANTSPVFNTEDMAGTASSRSYQLITIITNQGDRIDYTYTTTAPIKNLPNISKSITRGVITVLPDPFPPYMDTNITSYNYTEQPYAYINKITFNGGVLLFTMSDRIDQVGSKKLDKIELKTSDVASVPAIKTFNFNYDYFIGHTNGTNTDQYLTYSAGAVKTSQELTHRLRLLSVLEDSSKPYTFTYNAEPLPKKTSLASDYWGYYNGVLTNQSPFINLFSFGLERGSLLYEPYEAENKGSRLQHTKAAILERITYPTGGYTNYTYELNTFDNSLAKISPFIPYATTQTLVNSRNIGGVSQKAMIINNNGTILKGNAYLSTRGCTTADINSGANDNTRVKIDVFKESFIAYVQSQSGYQTYGLMYVLGTLGILNGSNTTLYNQYIDNTIYITKTVAEEEKIISNLRYVINKGIMVITATGGCGTLSTTNSSQAQLNYSYNDYYQAAAIESGAGLRVSAIDSNIGTGNDGIHKTYTYTSGRLMSLPYFFNSTFMQNYGWVSAPMNGNNYQATGYKKVLSSNSFISPSTSASGNYIGYDAVDEYTVNSQTSTNQPNIGRIRSVYKNEPDTDMVPTVNFSGMKHITNGQLSSETLFDLSGNVLKSTVNTYQVSKRDCSFIMKWGLTSIDHVQEGQTEYFYYVYDVGVYPLIAQDISLVNTTVYEYFGSAVMSTMTQRTYNSYNQPSYIKNTKSTGEIVEMFLYYPGDYNSGSGNAVALQMKESNVLAPLIKMESKTAGSLTFSEEYIYFKRLGNNNNFILPDIYSLSKYRCGKSATSVEDRVLYNQYDALGNPLDVSLAGGPHTAYIWGYNNRHVIAKFDNTTYGTITPSLITSAQSAANANNQTNLLTAINNLRASQPNALVSTFTYFPLIGLRTLTDSKGDTSSFEYDNLERLLNVRDTFGKILSENQYNYKP